MSREKQIEEIANILWSIPNNYSLNSYNDCERIAECIYDDGGYRKQREVSREIFDEIERTFKGLLNGDISNVLKLLSTLKKEYVEQKLDKADKALDGRRKEDGKND